MDVQTPSSPPRVGAITLAEVQASWQTSESMSTSSSDVSEGDGSTVDDYTDPPPPQLSSGRQAGRSCKKPLGFFVDDDAAIRLQMVELNGSRRRATRPGVQKRSASVAAAAPAGKLRATTMSHLQARPSGVRPAMKFATHAIPAKRGSGSRRYTGNTPSLSTSSHSATESVSSSSEEDDEENLAASRAFIERAAAVGSKSKRAWLDFLES